MRRELSRRELFCTKRVVRCRHWLSTRCSRHCLQASARWIRCTLKDFYSSSAHTQTHSWTRHNRQKCIESGVSLWPLSKSFPTYSQSVRQATTLWILWRSRRRGVNQSILNRVGVSSPKLAGSSAWLTTPLFSHKIPSDLFSTQQEKSTSLHHLNPLSPPSWLPMIINKILTNCERL